MKSTTQGVLMEKLSAIVDIDPDAIAQAHRNALDRNVLIEALRSSLFSVFERKGQKVTFKRWRSSDHVLVHVGRCKSRGMAWATEDVDDLTVGQAAVMMEMRSRADYLNETAIPTLQIGARARVLEPRLHHTECARCQARAAAISVTVEILYGDVVMRREYAL